MSAANSWKPPRLDGARTKPKKWQSDKARKKEVRFGERDWAAVIGGEMFRCVCVFEGGFRLGGARPLAAASAAATAALPATGAAWCEEDPAVGTYVQAIRAPDQRGQEAQTLYVPNLQRELRPLLREVTFVQVQHPSRPKSRTPQPRTPNPKAESPKP